MRHKAVCLPASHTHCLHCHGVFSDGDADFCTNPCLLTHTEYVCIQSQDIQRQQRGWQLYYLRVTAG